MSKGQLRATHSRDVDGVHLKGIDYIELWVGNAHQAEHFYRTAFGFTPIAYAGPETGDRERASFVVQQGAITLMLTAALHPDHPIAEHVKLHGDGIKDIAFAVDDVPQAFEEAVRRGAQPIAEPAAYENQHGRFMKATIAAYGDTVHSFIKRESGNDVFFPEYKAMPSTQLVRPIGITAIDHIAICVEPGTLNHWVAFYQQVFGFHVLHEEQVATEYSAMNTKAVQDPNGQFAFPIMEPAPGRRASQIETYLTSYRGPGVQHLAVQTDDIVSTVQTLQANGVAFRETPAAYYELLPARVGALPADVDVLRQLNILVDRDASGYLLQIFTKPLQGRPTLFCEIIQRAGAQGFGSGNIKALFESIERETIPA
jgi:4-hydroxyphenylpyruvate dioxygenase